MPARGFSFPCLSPGPEQKKDTLGGVFFLLCPPKGRGAQRSATKKTLCRAKKDTCSGPVPAPNGASPSPAFPRGRSKKKTHPGWCFFFALAPCRRPTGLLLPLPFAGAAAKKKKTPWVVIFFLLWPRAGTGILLPLPFPGAGAKNKNTLGVFFVCCGPARDAHSLTAGLGGDASPSPGWCFFCFFAAAPPEPVWCFFLAVAPPGRSLTHCGLGRFRQGPGGVFFFFLLRPRRVFLDNNKNVWGTTSGLKRPGGATAKKKHHFQP